MYKYHNYMLFKCLISHFYVRIDTFQSVKRMLNVEQVEMCNDILLFMHIFEVPRLIELSKT